MIVILYLAEFVFSQADGGSAPIYWEDTWISISWLGQGIDEEGCR